MPHRQRDWKDGLGEKLGMPEGDALLAQLDPDQACQLPCELIERQERQASAPLSPASIITGLLSVVSLILFLGFTQRFLSALVGLFLPVLFVFSYRIVPVYRS